MTKKENTISKEELSTYIPLRQETYVLIEKEEGKKEIIPLSTSVLVSPDMFKREDVLFLRAMCERPDELSDYPVSLYLLEVVGDIPEGTNYKDLSPEDKERIIAYYQSRREKKTEIKEITIPKVYKTPRQLSITMTRPRKKGKDLFSLLSDEDQRELQEKIDRGEVELISSLTSGLVLTSLQYKITKALGKILFAQSQAYNEDKKNYLGQGLPEEIVSSQIKAYDKDLSYIIIEPYKFSKEVLGREDLGGEDVKRVLKDLSGLDGKFYFDDRERAYYRLLTIEKIKPQEQGRESGQIAIALRPVFRQGLENDFINSREDELKLLSGIKSDISLRLFEVLKELYSYKLPTMKTSGYVQIKETELLERIAVKKSYDNQTKRKESDFESAVQDMKQIGILSKIPNNPRRVGGNLRFFLSPDWGKTGGE